MSIDEVTLLGIPYTDGCVSKKGNSWRPYVSNTSWEIISKFKQSLISLFSLNETRIRISEKIVNNKPFYTAIVNDYEIGRYLTETYGTFRTLKFKDMNGKITYSLTVISFMFNESKQVISQLLKVAFACDGGINLYVARGRYKWLIRNVYLACAHPILIKQYSDLLLILGVQNTILNKDCLVRIQSKNNLMNFANNVGFMGGVKITQSSHYWQGFAKQELLYILINS